MPSCDMSHMWRASCTTRSSSGPAAPDRPRRCCSPARATGAAGRPGDFPSDTVSTHIDPSRPACRAARWGLLDAVAATGCPPSTRYSFDFGPFTISRDARPVDGIARAYCPRRTVLDKLLVDAAAEAGAEVREGFTVEDVVVEDGAVVGIRGHVAGGAPVTESARVVIGADGRKSMVAKAVEARAVRREAGRSGLRTTRTGAACPIDGRSRSTSVRTAAGSLARTHDGLTLVGSGWPSRSSRPTEADIEGATTCETLELAPSLRRACARRRGRHGSPARAVPNFFRKPYGPGWALVGDAGYTKDPMTAHGIKEAFLDAERLSEALEEWFAGSRRSKADRRDPERDRRARSGRIRPHWRLRRAPAAARRATATLPAVSASQDTMDDFVSMMTGTLPVPSTSS